jgi:hypothetical protein
MKLAGICLLARGNAALFAVGVNRSFCRTRVLRSEWLAGA